MVWPTSPPHPPPALSSPTPPLPFRIRFDSIENYEYTCTRICRPNGSEGGALAAQRNRSANHLLQPNIVTSFMRSGNRPLNRSIRCCVNLVGVILIFSQKCMDSRRFHNGKTNIWTSEDRSINLEGRVSYQERKFRFALKSK